MRKGIFIVHHSEIIRRGLHASLRNYLNTEITLLSSDEELRAFTQMAGKQIIIFTGNNNISNVAAIRKLKQRNHVHIIGITNSSDRNIKPRYQYMIHLETSGEHICRMVREAFKERPELSAEDKDTGELTIREKEVLKLVALGNANKEIAEKLFISVHTVISHRKNITEKLGIKSISGLTVYAILNKFIDPETIDPENLI